MAFKNLINNPLYLINKALGIKGELFNTVNDEFSFSDGKVNLLLATSALANPLLQSYLSSSLNFSKLVDLPYVAIDNGLTADFLKKALTSTSVELAQSSEQPLNNFLHTLIKKRLEDAIVLKLLKLQLSNDGLTNIHIANNDKDRKLLEDAYKKDIAEFVKDYMACTFGLLHNVITIATRSVLIYKSVRQLMDATSKGGAHVAIRLSIITGTFILTELISKYLAKKANINNADISKTESTVKRKIIGTIDKKSLSNEQSFEELKKLVRDSDNTNLLSTKSLLDFGGSLARKTRTTMSLAFIGPLVIEQGANRSFYHDIIRNIDNIIYPFTSLFSLLTQIKELHKSSKKLTNLFDRLEGIKQTAERQKLKIEVSDEARISIKNMTVDIKLDRSASNDMIAEGSSSDNNKLTIKVKKFIAMPGDVIALKGIVGSGKTAFFKALAYGIGIGDNNAQSIKRGKVYLNLSDQTLDENQSLYENIVSKDRQGSISKEKIKEQLRSLGLDEFCEYIDNDTVPKNISSGQNSCLMLLKAVNSDAKVIMLDEIFSRVDANPKTKDDLSTRQKMQKLIKEAASKKDKVFIIIDHDVEKADSYKRKLQREGFYTKKYHINQDDKVKLLKSNSSRYLE